MLRSTREMRSTERAFGLFPSERILWEGRPVTDAPRPRGWRWVPLLLVMLAAICALFAGLLVAADLAGASNIALVALYMAFTAGAIWVAPTVLRDRCRFAITDRRVIWVRGRYRRSIDRRALSYMRVAWHPSVPTVGDLELVRAVPFGPLSRTQRIVLHDLRAPDSVLALVRGVEAPEHGGDRTIPLTDRLGPGEDVLWGAAPEGSGIDWRHALTTLIGSAVLVVGLPTGLRSALVLADLERRGLPTGSWIWLLLFTAILLTATLILAVGLGLFWHGVVRARAMRRDTEYVLTDGRLLIRRGHIELSVERNRIVDVAETPGWGGLTHLYLVLDGPGARALADSGAMGVITPSRDRVEPILFELRDPRPLYRLLQGRISRPSVPTAAR